MQHKILTTKQMPQKLPITLTQIKSGNIFKNLQNKICQIIYYLNQAKEITEKGI